MEGLMIRLGLIRSTLPRWDRVQARTLPATLTFLFVALVLVLSACGGGSTGPQSTTGSKYGGTLNAGLPADVTTLDPLKSGSLYDRQAMLNIYDRLVRIDENNTVQTMLAKSWQYTDNNTTLTFTLRDDVKFHDGTPFN